MTNDRYALLRAAGHGADTRIDPEVAADLGITTPDSFESQAQAGREVGRLLDAAYAVGASAVKAARISDRAATAPDAKEHAELGVVPPEIIK